MKAQDFIITLVKIEISGCMHAQLGGGGVLQISSDRNDQMGAKITTPKNPSGFKQNSPKIPGPKSNSPNPFICLTLSLLPKKNICQNFPTQKNPEIKNFKPRPPPPPPIHGNNSSHAQGPTTSRTWQVRGPFCKL